MTKIQGGQERADYRERRHPAAMKAQPSPNPSDATEAETDPALDDEALSDGGVLEAIIPDAHAGQRTDKVLAALFPQYSRSRLQHWCEAGLVQMGGRPAGVRDKARAGEVLRVVVPTLPEDTAFAPEDLRLPYSTNPQGWSCTRQPETGAAPCSTACWRATPKPPRCRAQASSTAWTRTPAG
jgi:hypothetical protein